MEDKIIKHLKNQELDIRKLGIKTCFDQKGKIDVVSFLAECVLELIKDNESKEFGTNDMWELDYFEKNVPVLFNKTEPSDPTAINEYDKFVSQPLLVFYYSGLLTGKKKGSWKFICKHKELLDYVSRNPRNAHNFLAKYYEAIFVESGLKKDLTNYIEKQDQKSYDQLKDAFYNLLLKNTPLGSKGADGNYPGKTESNRIFNPILNTICAKRGLKGTVGGNASKHTIRYDELQYNRINFRDKYKEKELTRTQAAELSKIIKSTKKFYEHQEKKAFKDIKMKYGKKPMFLGERHECDNPQIHHIVLKSDKIQFRGYPENLINLSPTQHMDFAHGKEKGMNTKQADPLFQRKLLIANSFYIERSLNQNENLYSKDQFIELLQEGLELEVNINMSFDDIRIIISNNFFEQDEINKIKQMIIS